MRAIPFLRGVFQVDGTAAYSIGGEAPKDMVFFDGFDHAYIAKKPGDRKKCATRSRVGPLECVTEYMIARIGATLPLRVAGARLVRLPGQGDADVRFMSRYFLKRNQEQLTHGLELVARCLDLAPRDIEDEIKPGGAAEREFYTVNLVDEVLQLCANADARTQLRDAFARMMAFDAIVGANDRHPWNWGVIENVLDPSQPMRFAPVYDTARGLFWNHSDETLSAKGRSFIQQYADGSKPLISVDGISSASHFDVIDFMVSKKGASRFGAPVREVIGAFRADECTKLLHSIFRDLVSRERLELVDGLLRYRHAKLIQMCRRR